MQKRGARAAAPRRHARPPGYEVAEVAASRPAEVRIAGPKSRVQEVRERCSPSRSPSKAPKRTAWCDEVNIGLDDPVLRIQGIPQVTVTARIARARAERTFDGLRRRGARRHARC